jgi:hypothetical protein
MVDHAAHWYQSYKHSAGVHSWEHFMVAVSQEFEVNTHRVKTMALINLRQTGSVEDYKNQFEQLVYHIKLYDGSLSETMLASQFFVGLKEGLRQAVELHLPDTISQVATLAAIQEHLHLKHQPHSKKFSVQKVDSKSTFNNSELWRARQLKEYRRLNNLFKCGEKYTPAHSCSSPTRAIHLIQHTTVDGREFLSEELLDAIESPQLNLKAEEGYLSLHAMFGNPLHKSVQLRALVKNQALIILVDSRSSHTLLNSAIASKLQVSATPIAPLSVKMANGELLSYQSEVKDFEFWIQGHTFTLDSGFRVTHSLWMPRF